MHWFLQDPKLYMPLLVHCEGWRMVKSKTRRDTETLVWKSEPKTQVTSEPNKKKMSLRDSVEALPRFQDRAKIFRDPRFSGYHLPPLLLCHKTWIGKFGQLALQPLLLEKSTPCIAHHNNASKPDVGCGLYDPIPWIVFYRGWLFVAWFFNSQYYCKILIIGHISSFRNDIPTFVLASGVKEALKKSDSILPDAIVRHV